MRFGVFDFGLWHDSELDSEVYRRVAAISERADALGFDSVWLGEHHFSRHGIIADTMTMAAYVAARTSRVRIGTAVIVLGLHNPIRLAEQVAMVDILSGGRLDIGIGSGYQRREFTGLGLSIDDARGRFKEAIDVMRQCWRQGPIALDGQYLKVAAEEGIEVYPKPVQKPHPPLYQAVSISRASIDFAASQNIPVILGGPTDVLGLAPQVIRFWKERMAAYGHDPEAHEIPCSRGIYVAATDEQAAADLADVDVGWDHRLLQQIGSPLSKTGEIPPGYEDWVHRDRSKESTILNRDGPGTKPLIGSPETVAERLAVLEAAGVTNIFGAFALPGMPLDKMLTSMTLFAEQVIPKFRNTRTKRREVA